MDDGKSTKRIRFRVLGLFFVLTSVFLYPIFLGKVFFPGDLLYQWPPWSLSSATVLKNVLPINNPLLGDPVTAFYPWFTYFKEALHQGALPLWNPLVMAGAPFLANWQSGALAIENSFFYFLSTPLALNIHIFLKVFLALSFTYLFLRKLNLSREASIFGAIAYAFSAFFIVWLNWPQTRVAIWLPLILFTIEYLLEKPDFKRMAFVSLSMAAAILAGHPGTLVQVIIIVFAYSIIRIFLPADGQFLETRLPTLTGNQASGQELSKGKKMLFLAGGLALGFGLGAILILPGYEFMKESYQFTQRDSTDYLKLALGPGNLVLLFFPRFYGHLKDGIYVGPANFNEVSVYVGLLPLFFSLWAITSKDRLKNILPVATLAVFGSVMVYSLWPQSLLYKLPLVAMQPTQRYIFILTFALSVLGAFGFDAFLKDNNRFKRFVALGLIFVVATAITFYKMPPAIWPSYKKYFVLTLIPFAALFGVYIKQINNRFKWLMVGLLFADLFVFGFKLNSFIKPQYVYPDNAITSYINNDKSVKRVLPLVDTMLPNSLMPYSIGDLRGRDALISNRFNNFASLLNDKVSLPQMPNFVLPNKIDSKLIDFLNVKYIVSESPAGNTLPRRLISSNGFAEVYKGQSQGQTFVAEQDNLAGIGLLIGTFKMVENPATFKFSLFDSSGKAVRQKQIKASYLRDNSFYSVYFKPIEGSAGQKYKFTIEGPAVPKKLHIATYISNYDQYGRGNHLNNNTDQAGDMVFYIQYRNKTTKFKPVFRYKNLSVYKNARVFPRAFAANKPVVINKTSEALKLLSKEKIDLRSEVILNKKPAYRGKTNGFNGRQSVAITDYKPDNISIKANLGRKSIIIISDNYYPGWKAYVDGQEAPIYLANASFRAVAVKRGQHKVELVYAPESFRKGLIVTILSLLLIMSFVFWPLLNEKFRIKNEK